MQEEKRMVGIEIKHIKQNERKRMSRLMFANKIQWMGLKSSSMRVDSGEMAKEKKWKRFCTKNRSNFILKSSNKREAIVFPASRDFFATQKPSHSRLPRRGYFSWKIAWILCRNVGLRPGWKSETVRVVLWGGTLYDGILYEAQGC